ncbi:MAG: response regulator transcription factor [Actinobacteria bacterium]|nr:response regulator transcription factor [Actinomycetota bacterium]
MTTGKILVVDDEASVRNLVRSYLVREGYDVIEADNGADALKLARTGHPDLVVLDLMIPEVDGLEVCRILRSEMDVFILMLTARAEEADKLLGLGLGADDYLTKPFSPRELIARVKAILRRGQGGTASTARMVRAGQVEIDSSRHVAMVSGTVLDLTAREFDILSQLASRPGMVFTREKLLELVWGTDFYGDPRVVDVHVAKLRKKLEEDAAHPRYLITVRGVGYKLETGEK